MMRQILRTVFGAAKTRPERLADEGQLPSLGELRMAKAMGKYRRASGERTADAVRRFDEAMSGVRRDS